MKTIGLRLLLTFVTSALLNAHTQAQTTNKSATLNLTAISTSNGASVLECWALKSTPVSFAAASNYYLGGVSNATYSVIPPRTVIGLRNAPFVQFSIVLSGLVHIRIPNSILEPSKSEAWIEGDGNGLLIAADIRSQSQHGHFTEFPSDAATVLVQIPMANGEVPGHDLLHTGPCGWEELDQHLSSNRTWLLSSAF